jgi:hypothetical protein
MSDDDPFSRALGIVPDPKSETIKNLVKTALNDSAKDDFTYARANVREVVENGNDAIHKLASIAEQTQNPRAYEVLAKLMDTVVSANKELLTLQKQIRELDNADMPQNEDARTINNNLYVGSTAELAKLIEGMNSSNTTIINCE